MPSERRVFLLGIDGLPPRTLRRFMDEGRLPAFQRLAARAGTVELVPTLPPLTAPGWLTIASGAHPSTLGVESILLPTPGRAPDEIANGFDARHSTAEYLWETLDRQGMGAVVLKYPGSWPPRPGGFVQVDGAGGYADLSCRFEALPSAAYVAGTGGDEGDAAEGDGALFPAGYRENWRIHTGAGAGVRPVVPRPPVGWRNLPEGDEPAWECVLPLEAGGGERRGVLHALAVRGAAGAALLVARDKDAAGALRIAPGAWSEWWRGDDGRGGYAFRFKLLELDAEAGRLRLYRGEAHRLDGFTRPPELAGELVARLGPVCEWTGTYDVMNGLLDLEGQLELYDQHTAWLEGAIRHLAESRDWRGFFTQWHPLEYAHHLAGASLHPEHPLHDPARAGAEMEFLAGTYALADRLLATVEEAIDDNTLLVVTGDHGHDLVHTLFYVNRFLQRRGWLAVTRKGGRPAIDWSRTRAYALFPGAVFFNVAERWPGGCVAEGEVPGLAEALGAELQSLRDPRTGRPPVKVVLDRDDLAAFGQRGARAPDLFFCMHRGYEPATRLPLEGDAAELELTVPGREVTSGHGSFFPASASARTMAFLRGPGVAPGPISPYPAPLVDLAPTMAAFLGVVPPAHCEGRPLAPRPAHPEPVS